MQIEMEIEAEMQIEMEIVELVGASAAHIGW
jgi:hypothetical protein